MQKPDIITHFKLTFNIYNLHGQVYALAKFQLHMPRTFRVIVLQSSNNRTIDLYKKYRENILPALAKTIVTHKQCYTELELLPSCSP